jgi:hypothetical protein
MAKSGPRRTTRRELREGELHMTGRPPASGIGFIGFVPAVPVPPTGGSPPAGTTGSNDGQEASNNSAQADDS